MSEHHRYNFHRGFSIVELLVAVTVISLVIGLLLMAVQGARGAARRVDCSNRLRQIVLSIQQFEDRHGHLPTGSGSVDGVFGDRNYNETSFLVEVVQNLQPTIDEDYLDQAFWLCQKVETPSVHSKYYLDASLSCPSDGTEYGTNYRACGGSNAPLQGAVVDPLIPEANGAFQFYGARRLHEVTGACRTQSPFRNA